MKKDTSVEMVKLSAITPDVDQPRKNFDPRRLGELAASIQKHGIMNPIIVEDAGSGKYIVVDGERRFRAATEIGLKEVPVIIVEAQSAPQRLIQQFHLQEQHENWSPIEKAVAVGHLAKELGMSITSMAETLSLPSRTIGDYVGFSKIIDKESFIKNEVPIGFATTITNLRTYVRNLWARHDKEFTTEMEQDLERSIIARFRAGSIKKGSDITKLRDSIRSDHTSVLKFMKNDNLTVEKLFLDTNAKAAWHYRNLMTAAQAITSSSKVGLALGMAEMMKEDEATKGSLKHAVDSLNTVLRAI